jgi:CRP-like cAMP-binding protein
VTQASDIIEIPPTPLFGGVSQNDWAELLKTSVRLELGANEPVFLQGEDADAFFVVLTGSVQVRSKTAGGETPLAHLNAGAVLGETSLLLGGKHSASLHTAEPSTLLRFKNADFQKMIEQSQHGAVRVLFNIAHTLAIRLRAADAHIAEASRGSSPGSVVRGDLDRLRNIFFTEWV